MIEIKVVDNNNRVIEEHSIINVQMSSYVIRETIVNTINRLREILPTWEGDAQLTLKVYPISKKKEEVK
ncbi:hypothetical protein MBAV_001802 [Candidatus Magnetobacterium bavaricum]|uniref:Uncharacterized protein n=1 Tax=Candidatus Magnetobacterium bavaricum TaxID=29290 RepID=A0A0F3GVW5_9BACT|nr:hypothetical protein MBAV_001802 [Candidatus Magnetobacterium bavaricum]